MKTIFVQIASYRDPECQWTVKDLFSKAGHPERVHVGICWQYDPEHDSECFKTAEWPDQVRITPFHWQESEGVCWARHQAKQLWDGEDYVLSIDSHMRFAPKWDELLIRQLAECPSPKAILSNHPAAYTPPDKLQTDAVPTILRAHLYSPQGDLRIRGVNLSRAPEKPLRGAFCAGGFIFAENGFIRDIPYDPYLYFDQEEIALSARLFTHGFDVYSLKDILLYHYYRDGADAGNKHPPQHWDDNPGWLRLQDRARKRLGHLLGHTLSENPHITRDIEKYGLGTARSLKEYESFCGVDFRQRIVSDRALRCGFIEDLSRYLDNPIHIPEIDDAPKPIAEAAEEITVKAEPSLFPMFDQPLAIKRLMGTEPNGRNLNIDNAAPEGVMIVYDYLDAKACTTLKKYADSQAFTDLYVVDPKKTTAETIVTQRDEGRITNHVEIDGKALEILNIFNDVYCNRMASFYDVNFEWYERPQILRYPPGGKYDQHADADHWEAATDTWSRVQDRDYSVLLYLNDEYEGGELELVNQKLRLKPKPGMLLAFPSDHRYLHAALPTTSGLRYVIVSWAAIMGSKRVRAMPYGSIYVRQNRNA
jgi:predicted 2-oxoglutarate/Fe(II)-dependent dioxygenase YbiX